MTRYYGRWAGNPKGFPEDVTRCVREVGDYVFRQCSRRRGHGPDGLFCKVHGRLATKRPDGTFGLGVPEEE